MVGSQNPDEYLLKVGKLSTYFRFIEPYPIFYTNVAFKLPLSCG